MSATDLPPAYPIDEDLRIRLAALAGAPPVQERPGFFDRLAAGLAQIQAPQGGRAGDQFGANFLAGAGRAFGGNRLDERDRQFKQQMQEFERGKAAKGAEAQARLAALGKDYELNADIAKSRATKAPSTDITVDPAMAKAQPELAPWVGRAVPRDWLKPQSASDAEREKRRQFEVDRDFKLRTAAENRQAKKDAADAAAAAAPGGGKPPTVDSKRAAAFAERGRKAISNHNFIGLEDRIVAGGNNTLLGLGAPRMFQNDEQKKYRQSVETFALAFLRQESMASIKDEEFNQVYRTFFAQPGENAETIAGKRLAREAALIGQEQQGESAGSRATPPIPATWKKVE